MNPNNSIPETNHNTSLGQADGNAAKMKAAGNRNVPPSSLSPELISIWQHWEQRGRKYGMSPSASWVDETMLHREGEILSRYLRTDDMVLDAGCANGYTTIQLARNKRIRITGVDYAASMIEHAQLSLNRAGHIKGSAFFKVSNFLALDFPDNTFDKVITKRCLINLGSHANQKRAMLEAYRVLKPGGLFLVSEVSVQTAEKLNGLRQRFGLEPMSPLWHNCYIDENDFLSFARPYFEVKNPVRFSSSYYFITWVLYPYFVRSGQRNYRSFLHKMSAVLPQFGDCGLQKLYIFKKRG